MMRYLLVFFGALALAAPVTRADVTLVENGEAKATVVCTQGDRPAEFAAGQLVYWLREITGADLPVVKIQSLGDTKIKTSPCVFIGTKLAAELFPEDVKWLGDTQGFAVREKDGNLHIFGAGVGSLFGCYDVIEKNSDIIWPTMAEGVDRIFTPHKTFVAKTGYREKPAIARRLVMHDRSARAQYFFLRNRAYSNWEYHTFKAFGIKNDEFQCHNIGVVFRRDEIRQAHPEWFGLYRGKRMMNPGGFDGNICFSHLDSADWYAERFIEERLPATLSEGPYGIGAEDNNMLCECELCLKPIKLPDGRLLKKEDDETLFRSTQFYLWINRCAEHIKAQRPDVRLQTIAYMYGQCPPAIDLCDNLIVQYAPIGKNMKKDYYGKGNEKQRLWLDQWAERCSELAFFEYWGDGAGFPRPISKILAVDIPYMLDRKTTYVNTEWAQEDEKQRSKYVSALEFWVVFRLMWNPERPLEELREEFFQKAFREGAAEMRVFYDSLRDAWYKDASTSFYYDNPVRLTGYYFLGDAKLKATCFTALSNAYARTRHPVAREFVRRIKDSMEAYLDEAAKTFVQAGSAVIPKATDGTITALEGVAWGSALVLDDQNGMQSMLKMKLKESLPVEARIAHDGRNLYFRFRAGWRPAVQKASSRTMWSNEHWEILLQADKTNPDVPYYLFGLDPFGNQNTYIGYSAAPNPPKWSVQTRRDDESWDALVTLPFDEVGIRKNIAPRLHLMHHSQVEMDRCEWKSWHSYGVHDAASFTECKLENE